MSQTKQLSLPLSPLPPVPAMPSCRCESCAVWKITCSIPGKITPFGPCHEAQQYNKEQGSRA